jgi:hypothetical protein
MQYVPPNMSNFISESDDILPEEDGERRNYQVKIRIKHIFSGGRTHLLTTSEWKDFQGAVGRFLPAVALVLRKGVPGD